ncbi:MAG: DUF4251 domain-containing protein [Bacteroidota bacterium]|nr:DUF4251 domain-containing protein [Bacteroidota bacterium]
MKATKYQPFFKFFFLGIFISLISTVFFSCSSSKKAAKLNVEDIRSMINAKQFTFVAERVNPLRGSSRILTSNYDVQVKKDTIECYLPYFGRAYQAPIDPTKGGLDFTSYKFTYNVTLNNNDEWQVYINPKDYSDVQQLYFQIFGNGTATLNVVNTNRDPISFYGYIKKNDD